MITDYRIPLKADYSIQPPELLGGLFPKKHLTVIASKPGLGKTWFILWQSCKLSSQDIPVVILNGETGREMMIQRMNIIDVDYNPKFITMYSSSNVGEYDINISSKEGLLNIETIVNFEQPQILFIDSLISFLNGDESDMQIVRNALVSLKNIAETYDIAIVLNHHLRKRKSSDLSEITQDDVIGSSAISRLAGLMYYFSREDDCVTATCLKTWFNATRGFSFIMKRTNEGKIAFGSSFTTSDALIDKVMEYIEGTEGEISLEDISDKFSITDNYASRIVTKLHRAGKIHKRRDNRKLLVSCVSKETTSDII